MNNTIIVVNDVNDEDLDRLSNDSTFTDSPSPYDNGTNEPHPDQHHSNFTTSLIYMFLFACLIVFVWLMCMSTARVDNSPRTAGQDGEETEEKHSVEELNEIIVQQFDTLGNQTTLAESNFRMEDTVQKSPRDISRSDNIDGSDDKSLSRGDLEEGPADYNGLIALNRVANDELSEEITAPSSCAICLEKYRCGEMVVWSANENCHHIYHKGCIAAYFAHARKKGKCLCPVCRQEFLVISDGYRDEAKLDQVSGLNAEAADFIVEAVLGRRI